MRAALALLTFFFVARAAAGGFESGSDSVLTLYDRAGNAISIANQFDGATHSVEIDSTNRQRGFNWSRSHSDGYAERYNTAVLDASGNIYLAGMRLFQNRKYLWAAKYRNDGYLLWEQADTVPDCLAMSAFATENGELWMAGSCLGNGNPVRVLRYAAAGHLVWGQSYLAEGRSLVRGLSVDFADRVSITLETSGFGYGGGSSARTVVFDRNGGRIALF